MKASESPSGAQEMTAGVMHFVGRHVPMVRTLWPWMPMTSIEREVAAAATSEPSEENTGAELCRQSDAQVVMLRTGPPLDPISSTPATGLVGVAPPNLSLERLKTIVDPSGDQLGETSK
jgi:hypothetical protein